MTTSHRTPHRSAVTVTRNEDRRRYEAFAEGTALAGFVDYRETREPVVLIHTEVDPSFQGQAVGSALARAALDDIRDRRLKALVICPFINSWLRRHPDYSDVLFHAPPAQVGNEAAT
jgi:predicted GNAT family acetyltransferase